MKWKRIRAGEYECEFNCRCQGWITRLRATEWEWILRYDKGFTDYARGTCWTMADAMQTFGLQHATHCRGQLR